jgi:hypothetical protein
VPTTGPHACDSNPAPLALTARCSELSRTINFLTGAIMSYGAELLSRRFDPEGAAELEAEFPRIACVDIYCMLVAAGLDLDRDSHLRLTAFCQCTREQLADMHWEQARMIITLREPAMQTEQHSHPSYGWLIVNNCQETYEA